MRSAAATNKAAHEKLLSETRLQFGRINAEISQARSERDALRNQLEQSSTQQSVDQTASNAQHSRLQAELSSTQAALAQARQEAADAKQLATSGASSEQLVKTPLLEVLNHRMTDTSILIDQYPVRAPGCPSREATGR